MSTTTALPTTKRFSPSYRTPTRASGGGGGSARPPAGWWGAGAGGGSRWRAGTGGGVSAGDSAGTRQDLAVVREPRQLAGKPLALGLTLLQRRLHGGELRFQRVLLLLQQHVHRGDLVVQRPLLRVLGAEARLHRAAGLERRRKEVVDRLAEAGRAAQEVLDRGRVRGERARELRRVEHELALDRVLVERAERAAGRDPDLVHLIERRGVARRIGVGHRDAQLAQDALEHRVAAQ